MSPAASIQCTLGWSSGVKILLPRHRRHPHRAASLEEPGSDRHWCFLYSHICRIRAATSILIGDPAADVEALDGGALRSALEKIEDAIRNEAAAHRQDVSITMPMLMTAE